MNSPLHTDEHLDHWGDRFIAAGLADVMSFRRFMTMTPARRLRHIERMDTATGAQRRCAVPADATVHGDRLIDPMQHGPRLYRYHWWQSRRLHRPHGSRP